MKTKKITVLDLFSGCWWLTEWFFDEDYSFVGHVEMDLYACESLKTRIVYHYLKRNSKLEEYYSYLRGNISRDFLVDKYNLTSELEKVYNSEISDTTNSLLITQIKQNLNGEDLWILIGGPPCQTYSHIWRSRVGKEIENDSRNYLYLQYAKFLKGLQPEMFVFENVPGLRTAGWGKYLEGMKKAFEKAWYYTETWPIVEQYMPDYGIVQNRKRLVIIWWKKKSNIIKQYPDIAKYKIPSYNYTVNDFLSDLPDMQAWGGEKIMKYKKNNQILIDLWIRDKDQDEIEGHITRPIRDLDKKIYKIAVEEYENWKSLIYETLPEYLKTHQNTKNFQNRFCVVKWKDKITNTVVAHISKDWHYYIHPDKKQNRSLSIRESARVQSFPDNFKFEWPRTAVFRQIGNAVPPMFSKIVAKELKKYFL